MSFLRLLAPLAHLLTVLRRVPRFLHLSARTAIWLILCGLLIVGGMAATMRYYVLPRLDIYRQQLSEEITASLGRSTRIAELRGEWRTTHIHLEMRGLQILDRHGAPALSVDRAVGDLSWWSLVRREPLFRDLHLSGALLRLGRDAHGRLWLGDLPLRTGGERYTLPDWLLRQERVSLRNGRLMWQDRPGVLDLKLDDARYERGLFLKQARLVLRPQSGAEAPWRLDAQWRGGRIKDMQRWKGSLQLNLPGLRIESIAPWLDTAAASWRGRLSTRLKAEFKEGRLSAASGEFSAHNLHLSLGKRVLDYTVLEGRGELEDWKAQGRRLEFERLRLARHRHVAVLDGLRLAYRAAGKAPPEGEIELPRFDLSWLTTHVPAADLRSVIDLPALAPVGRLHDVRLGWQGDWPSPSRYRGSARLEQGGWRAHGELPGLSGVNAGLVFDEASATIDFKAAEGRPLSMDMPRLFDRSLSWQRFDGRLHWRRAPQAQEFVLEGLALANADVAGELKGRYNSPTGQAPRLELDGEFGRVQATVVAAYLPKVVHGPTREWLSQAFRAGAASRTRLVLHGEPGAFPFADGRGLFRVASELQGVQLHYGQGWPTVDDIHGRMVFEGRGLRINATSARILGTQVGATEATIAALDDPKALLSVKGTVQGKTRGFLDFLQQSPLSASLGGLASALDAEGEGRLSLGLDLPLDDVEATRVRGLYQFEDNRLRARGYIPPVERLSGAVSFTERGASMQQGRGAGLGGEFGVDVRTRKDGVTEVEIKGRADAALAARFYRLPLAERAEGQTGYRLLLADEAAGLSLQLQSDLAGVALTLPQPFGKTAAQPGGFQLQMRPAGARRIWGLSYQQLLGASFVYAPQGDDLVLERGEIRVGGGQLPAAIRNGIWLSGRLPLLRVAEWQSLLGAEAVRSGAGLDGADITIDMLEWRGWRWPALALDLRRQGTSWSGGVQSPLAQGSITFDTSGKSPLLARLDSFNWPAREAAAGAASAPRKDSGASQADDPSTWPELDLTVEHLRRQGRELGRLRFKGEPVAGGYRLKELHLANADGQLAAESSWLREGGLWRGRAHLGFTGKDIGRYLARWGVEGLLLQGSGTFSADVGWLQARALPRLPELQGVLHLEGAKGTLLKVNPGVGRLLGLMNIESLLRRARLDFKDVLSQGLAIDKIAATARLQQGRLLVESMSLVGPALGMAVEGSVDMESKALDLRIKVVPAVSGGVAVAGAMVNPVVGLSLLLVQQLLSNPVGKLLTYTYNVGGTWSRPDVRSQGQPAPEQEATPQGP